MLNIKPSENTRLYGLEKELNQFLILYKNNKLPNKILLSGKKGLGKATMAYHLINHILSKNEEFKYDIKNNIISKENKSYKLILNNVHPNFYPIDLKEEKKNIDISQIREMIQFTNKSSFNLSPRFILIDNVENLNKNSVNALLKVIEEPNNNIYFILIHNNEKKILPTLKSRTLLFNINLSFDRVIEISNKLLNKDLLSEINSDLINYYNSPGQFVKLIIFANEKKISLTDYNLNNFLDLLISNVYYKKDIFVKNLIIDLIELFFLKEYKISKTKKSLLKIYHKFVDKIHFTQKYNLDEEALFLEFQSRLLNG